MSGVSIAYRPNPRSLASDVLLRFGTGTPAAVTFDSATSGLVVRTTGASNVLIDRLSVAAGSAESSLVVNEPGVDLDFRVEGVGQPNLLFTEGATARVGVGTGAPATRLHVAGAVTVEQDAARALIVYRPSSTVGAEAELSFDARDASGAQTQYGAVAGVVEDATAGAEEGRLLFSTVMAGVVGERARFTPSGAFLIGETQNTDMTAGLTVNQGTDPGEALALRSTQVAHSGAGIGIGVNTFMDVVRTSVTAGGATIRGFAETSAISSVTEIHAYGGTGATAKNTSTLGLISLRAWQHTSGTMGDITPNGNVLAISARVGSIDRTVMLVDQDGDLFVDGSSTLSTFDDFPDHEIARAIREVTAPNLADGPREFIDKYADLLEESDIVHLNRDTDGVPFINLKNLGLFNLDAVYQLAQRLECVEEALAAVSGAGGAGVKAIAAPENGATS